MKKIVIGFVAAAWLVVGTVAADQRGDFAYGSTSCSSLGEISLTMVAGPLNYGGVNPEVSCEVHTSV